MEAKIVVNGREYEIPSEFTLGEQADMEEITGQGYDLSRGGARGLLAIAYVVIRRDDPTVTVADLRALVDDDFEIRPGDGDAVIPPSKPAEPLEPSASIESDSELDSADSPELTLEPSGTPV